ncbi:unnamed protein product [Fraxinus pennsylvanica]|uniref:Uncharacterized protein n=1 Tax=Fraxinus pennsylvanica TaxID=56036 RepID=A0AAD1YX89_9LAMI|nr:unnamed protein product [Fraxinus pennsylvanica]
MKHSCPEDLGGNQFLLWVVGVESDILPRFCECGFFMGGVAVCAISGDQAVVIGGSISVCDRRRVESPTIEIFEAVEGAWNVGGKGWNNWDYMTEKFPESIADRSNGKVAIDHYNMFKEDVALMKEVGLDSYRFSISWSRILPGGRICDGISKEGIQFYNDLIDALLDGGIKPCATIFHWDVPQRLEVEYGGFLNHQIVEHFCEFAEICFWEFGDRVKYWVTLNEPWSFTFCGYVIARFPPRRDNPEDVEAASRAIDFLLGWFVAPVITGDYPPSMRNNVRKRLPKFKPDELALVKVLKITGLLAGSVIVTIFYGGLGCSFFLLPGLLSLFLFSLVFYFRLLSPLWSSWLLGGVWLFSGGGPFCVSRTSLALDSIDNIVHGNNLDELEKNAEDERPESQINEAPLQLNNNDSEDLPQHRAGSRNPLITRAKGCLAALDTAEKSTGSGGKKKGPAQLRLYNLGNTSPVPVSNLVSILERLLKVKAKRLIMKLPRNGDVQFTHANISLAQTELSYKPTTDLQTGLKKFVQWYLSYYDNGKKSSQ